MEQAPIAVYFGFYQQLLGFKDVESFEGHFNPLFEEADIQGQEEAQKFIKRTTLANGSYKSSKDEHDRIVFLKSQSKNGASLIVRNLDKAISAEGSTERQNMAFQKSISEIDLYLGKLEQKKSLLEKYPFLLTDLSSSKDEIIQKFKHLLTKEQLSKNNYRQTSNGQIPKIQWLGKTNVLLTLFYDLLNGQDKGSPLIYCNKEELKKYIRQSFLDKEGNELSESTIDTIFSDSKVDKRAKIGDRIEIPNKGIIR